MPVAVKQGREGHVRVLGPGRGLGGMDLVFEARMRFLEMCPG